MSGEQISEQSLPEVTLESQTNAPIATSNSRSTSDQSRVSETSSETITSNHTHTVSQTTDAVISSDFSQDTLPPLRLEHTPPPTMADIFSLAQMQSIMENATSQSYVLSTFNPINPSAINDLMSPAPGYTAAINNNPVTANIANSTINGQYFTHASENHDTTNRYTSTPPIPPPTAQKGYTPFSSMHQEFSVNDLRLVAAKKAAPKTGWRKGIYLLSGATINPGPSNKEKYQKTLRSVITKHLDKNYQISVLSMKGGVGKTTTSFILGSVLATMRNDNIIALDANPDFGTLAHRTNIHNEGNVRDLINDNRIIERSDITTYTNTTNTGLEILNSEMGNSESDGLTLGEYRNVMQKLGPFYRIVLTDCGTGIHHPSVQGSLEAAHVVIIPTVPSLDSARSTMATMDWLEKKGYGPLLKNSIILINSLRSGSANIDIEQLRSQFEPRVRAVHSIPYDPHIAEGGLLDLQQLHKSTLKAFIELAALVVENFF